MPDAACNAAAWFTLVYGSRHWDQPPSAWLAGLSPIVTPRLLDRLRTGSSADATATAMAAAHQVDTVHVDAVVPVSDDIGSAQRAQVTYTVTATPTTPATVSAGRYSLTVTIVDEDGRWLADALTV